MRDSEIGLFDNMFASIKCRLMACMDSFPRIDGVKVACGVRI